MLQDLTAKVSLKIRLLSSPPMENPRCVLYSTLHAPSMHQLLGRGRKNPKHPHLCPSAFSLPGLEQRQPLLVVTNRQVAKAKRFHHTPPPQRRWDITPLRGWHISTRVLPTHRVSSYHRRQQPPFRPGAFQGERFSLKLGPDINPGQSSGYWQDGVERTSAHRLVPA